MLMIIAIPYWMNPIQAQNQVPAQNTNQAQNQVPALAVPVQVVPVQALPIQDQVPHLVEVLLLVDHLVVLVTLQVSY